MVLPQFGSPEAEASFWASHDARTFPVRVVSLVLCFLSFTVFALLDFHAGGASSSLMLVMRGVASAILLLALFRFAFVAGTPDSRETLIALCACGCISAQLVFILVAPDETSQLYQFGLGVILAVGALMIVPRFSTTLVMFTYTIVLYLFSLPWQPGDAMSAVVNSSFNIMIAGAVLVGSFMRESIAREQAVTTARLAALNDDLEASRLEAMDARDVAIAANRAKNHFFASVSHELRTPLNAILGFSDMIRSGIFGSLAEPRYADYIDYIHASGLILQTNIEDLLDLARLEAGKFGWQEGDFLLDEVFETALATCAAAARTSDIVFTVHRPFPDVIVTADATRLAQALTNLITNALKFTDAGGEVTFRATEGEDGSCALTVRDTGCGMSPENIERVRIPFAQAHDDSYSKGKGGLGLGLAIVSGIVGKMEGRLDLESEEGVGTTATLVIPAHRVAAVMHEVA